MKFADPGWLWALAGLPVAYALLSWDERRRKRQFGKFAHPEVWARIAPEVDWGVRLRKARLWSLALAFILFAMARPQWGSHEEVVHVSGLDILVVLDVSNSMEVEDIVPNRLKKAKHLVKSMAEHLQGDRMGAVAFAGSSYLASPLTTDLDYLAETVSILTPKMVLNQGTDVGVGLETARKALERGAEEVRQGGAANAAGVSSRAVVLISDGEDQENGAIEAARKLKEAGIKLYVIGVGTAKGGPIPVRDESGNLMGYKRDRSGQPVVSSFRPDALMQVAAIAGGRYWNATAGEGELEEVLRDMGALSRSDYAERRFLIYEDRFQIPLALGVLLLLLELSVPARRLRRERASVPPAQARAVSVPTVWWIALVSGAMLALLGPPVVQAAPLLGKQPPLDVYLENEKGLKAFKKGDVEGAKREFGSAQAKDPSLPELQFNRGAVQLQEGDAEGAVEAFSNAARSAKEDPSGANEQLAGQSYFNLGAALSKKGDVKGAVASYLEAIDSARASGDQALEDDARKNIELLIRQQQEQRKQQKKDDQEKKDQQQQQDQKQQEKDGQKQDQAKRYQNEPKKRKFKSEKLSPEDAERVMAELSSKERDLQVKLKQKNGNASSSQRDW